MNEFTDKTAYKVKKNLEDRDFRHFAKQLAYEWAEFYVVSQNYRVSTEAQMAWRPLEDIMVSARFWNILNAELVYDLSEWLRKAEFVGGLPEEVVAEYESRFVVNREYINSLPNTAPKRYCYEQYFIYREVCKALGVDHTVTDEE